MGSALRGTGIVKPTMLVQVVTVLLNIVLAPVLIAVGAPGIRLASPALVWPAPWRSPREWSCSRSTSCIWKNTSVLT